MLNLVPPLFAKGGVFDVIYYAPNECGMLTKYHGLYWDNVYYTILYLSATFSSFTLPLLLDRKYKLIIWSSFAFGAWFLCGLAFELINFASPIFIKNSPEDRITYAKFLIAFIFILGSIITYESWIKQMKSEK